MPSADPGKLYIPGNVREVLDVIGEAGGRAWLAGGCLRDLVMGGFPSDWDAASDLAPEAASELFRSKGFAVVPTGIVHGTITVMNDGEGIEITTLRTEGAYSDGRHPDRVEFVSDITEDLSRRDFTMNAMAYSEEDGLIDPFGGIDDLWTGVIRSVGDPDRRFSEDGLRILRALRFASVLGFDIEEKTDASLRAHRELLGHVSAERITAEFTKLLTGRYAEKVLLAYPEVITEIIPELGPAVGFDQKNPHHIYDIYGHSCRACGSVPPRTVPRLAALLHDIGKPELFTTDEDGTGHFHGHEKRSAELAEEILRRMRYDGRTAAKTVKIIAEHGYKPEVTERGVRRALLRIGREDFADWLAVKRGDVTALAPEYLPRLGELDEIEKLAIDILAAEDCLSVRDLAIGGDDLLAIGIPEGPAIGAALSACLDAVIDGELENKRDELLRFAAGGKR